MLEVSHQDKILTFPPWKFNIIGPLALLELMGQRGRVGPASGDVHDPALVDQQAEEGRVVALHLVELGTLQARM